MMSMNYQQPLSAEGRAFMDELLGQQPIADDGKSFLYEGLSKQVEQAEMQKLANVAGQPVTVELHGEGEIKTLSDGTKYQVTRNGWRKVD